MTHACPQCATPCEDSHRFCPHCGERVQPVRTSPLPPQDPLINRTLPGGYVILELVGIGGMGRVYRAEQQTLGRTVAVKVIHPHLLGDEAAAARFITEARAASRLNHPNSVAVIDFGKTDDGQLYLVMEYLRGRDLARVSYEEGPLPIPRILDILRQTLAALAEAHHLGIVHRDLKPENIVLERLRSGADFVKVVDFGLAKMAQGPREKNITVPGIICGTPDYMAPEQGRGVPIDARADIYSIGVILFQLLTKRLPFEADSPTQVVLMHMTLAPPDPRQVAPERNIPDALSQVVLKALDKDPERRFASAEELSESLSSPELSSSVRSWLPPLACPDCGQPVLRSQKYCGECGVRVSVPPGPSQSVTSARMTTGFPGPAGQTNGQLPLACRDDDLAWLEEQISIQPRALTTARVVGATGVGKTRLLREFVTRLENGGALVVETGPDPFWAEVSYFAARRAISALAGIEGSSSAPREWPDASAEARLGLDEVFGRMGKSKSPSVQERRQLTARALRWALDQAVNRAGGAHVVLIIDDLHCIDGASRNIFADALATPHHGPVLVVGAHTPNFDPAWPAEGGVRSIIGIPTANALELARDLHLDRISLPPPPGPDARVLPLYLDQLVAFAVEGGSNPPPRLADLIALRIERLAPASRRVLQATAVLGDNVDANDVETLVPSGAMPRSDSGHPQRSAVMASIAGLTAQRFLERGRRGLQHQHPLVREIALGTIPAGVRRELHARAARIAEAKGLPLEVRAYHTLHAQDAFQALLLIEQVADRALARGDAGGAAVWLNRALELARLELFRGDLDDPMRAVLIFSRKLGEALLVAGDLTYADGVLREALDLAGPSGLDRAKVLSALCRVAYERGRMAEAVAFVREAVEQATRAGEKDLVESLVSLRRSWST